MVQPDPTPVPRELETLKAMLSAAAKVVSQYVEHSSSPQRIRWNAILDRMPQEDRETVLAAVEREVDLRVLTAGEGEPVLGISDLRPNPGARLYLRVFDGDMPNLHRDEIMLGTLRATRLMFEPDAPSPDVFGEAVHAAFRALGADERAALARHLQNVLQLLATCEPEQAVASCAK